MHKIAILDNDFFTSRMYEIKLRQHNFVVKTAFDGWSGLRLITTFRPDILLIDFHLPVLSGIETLEKLLHHPIKTPKIILASNLDPGIVENQSSHLPIDHYVTKVDHTPSEVMQIIYSLMPNPLPINRM